MSNYIIDKVAVLQRMDSDIDKHKSAANITISIKEAEIKTIKNSTFVNDCVGYISNFYNNAEQTVKVICDLQNGVNVAPEYKLKTYMNVEANPYKNEEFIQAFEKAAKEFSTKVKSIASAKTIQQVSSSNVCDELKKLAVAYATLKDINARARKLATEYATPRIDTKAKSLQDELDKFRKDSNDKTNLLIKNLKTSVEELENHIKEEEKKQALAFINNYDGMPDGKSGFVSDYKLCIGRSALRNQTVSFASKNINYNKTYSVSTLTYVNGCEQRQSSNIKLDISDFDEGNAYTFAENLIMKYISSYPGQFKKVVALHNQAGSGLLSVMSQTYNCGSISEFSLEKGMEAVANNDGSIENVLTILDKRINDVCTRIGENGSPNVYDYNAKNADTAQPIVLLVVKDFPSGMERSRSLELFKRVYEQGNKAGIITLVMWDKNKVKEKFGEEAKALEYIQKAPAAYDLVGNKDGSIFYGNSVLMPIERASGFSSQKFFENINQELKRQNLAIGLFDIQPPEDPKKRKNFSETLVIPIGKIGGKPISLELSSANKAHVVVNGGTGSGKTAFLHTLILSAANNYTPEELEINLFDFKDGVGFKMYKEERLPHVKFIALENKIDDAQEVLEFINSEMTRRNKLIGSIEGVSSLKGYNEKAASYGKPIIPRSLVIIDEYQFLLMNEKCVSVLENIARQGRSAGISLILVSQDVPNESGFTKIKQLLDHRFAFRGSPENVDRLITGAGRRAGELELQKGICFYEANDGLLRSMRAAFSGDDEDLAKNIRKITKKYEGKFGPSKLHIVGAPEPLIVNNFATVPSIEPSTLISDYIEHGVFNLVLGRFGLTGEPVRYVSDEENTLLTVIGGYLKSKHVITSIVCNHLITLSEVSKVKQNSDGKVILIDLCEQRRLVGVASPLNEIINKKCELDDEGEESVFNRLYCYDSDGFADAINYIYDIYEERIRNKDINDPIEVILIGANYYSDAGRVLDRLKDLIANGSKSDIYFTIQMDSFDSPFAKNVLFNRMSPNLVKDVIIVSDDNSSSLNVKNAINSISTLLGGARAVSEVIKSFDKSPLDPSLCLLIDDGRMFKYSYFQFEGNQWIESFVDCLK